MRVHSRLAVGLCGLALAVPVPSFVKAGPLGDDAAAAYAQPVPAPGSTVAPHEHKGLFGRRHCVECQRAYVKAHDGVDVPPPPGYPGGAGTMMANGTMVSGPIVIDPSQAPGYAVVGDAPGYAVVGGGAAPGADPTPIGVATSSSSRPGDPRMARLPQRPGGGPYDPSVMPSSLPPAQTPMNGPGHNRPHIISHVLGLPIIGSHRRQREEQQRQQHASIVYDQPNQKVAELPASLVYDKNSH